jgi:hypothetical protein
MKGALGLIAIAVVVYVFWITQRAMKQFWTKRNNKE